MAKDREEAIKLIKKKLNGETLLNYADIGVISGYHEKYILKLKKQLLNGELRTEHGNKNRKPVNTIPDDERQYIIDLFKRSNVSVRKFCKFYGKRSYSCIYSVLKKEGLLENSEYSRKNVSRKAKERRKKEAKKKEQDKVTKK